MLHAVLVLNRLTLWPCPCRYGITPWLDNLGLQDCFISAAFIGMAASSVFLVMIFYGKKFRERSRVKYWNLVAELMAKGDASI
jgi:hypothetical protein